MKKRVILITGTPCVGKTTLAQKLAQTLNAQYINLTDLAEQENLTLGKDKERDTTIIDEVKMRRKLKQIIEKNAQADLIRRWTLRCGCHPKNNDLKHLCTKTPPC